MLRSIYHISFNSLSILTECPEEDAALLEQKSKEEEKKQIESKQMMETEKVRHEDSVKQMHESFNTELQQQEMDRAIYSKLKKREEMLKKDLKEKTDLLNEEIIKLKNEKFL